MIKWRKLKYNSVWFGAKGNDAYYCRVEKKGNTFQPHIINTDTFGPVAENLKIAQEWCEAQ